MVNLIYFFKALFKISTATTNYYYCVDPTNSQSRSSYDQAVTGTIVVSGIISCGTTAAYCGVNLNLNYVIFI